MAAANLRHADAWLLRLLHRPFLLATEATGGSTAGPLLAISSDTYSAQLAAALNRTQHSDEAGFTSPFRRRICRGDRVRCAAHAAKRRGILSVPHAAEVHRFDMHAPGSPKRNRTTVRAHAVAIPHPSGNAVAGRAVTGMKIKGMPTFRTRARVWFDELATGPRDRPPKASLGRTSLWASQRDWKKTCNPRSCAADHRLTTEPP